MERLPKIVTQRLRATAKPGVHPDPDLLTAFAEKSLGQHERSQVLQHLAQCGDCRSVIALALPEAEQAFATAPLKSTWISWPVLRWGALAACVVVVSAAVTLRFERRQSTAPLVADKVAAPAAPSNLEVESQPSDQPAKKFAANITPPLPVPADRDFAGASRTSKQFAAGETKSAAGAPVPGLTTGGPRQNSVENNRFADADLFKSAEKPAQPIGQLAAAVPRASAPPPGPGDEPQSSARGDRGENLTAGINEDLATPAKIVPGTDSAQSAARKSKDETANREFAASGGAVASSSPAEQKTDAASATVFAGGYDARMRAKALGAQAKIAPRWTLSAEGRLQRSLDAGKTWQVVAVDGKAGFRALAVNDSDIWVGGSVAALYHSTDAGEHWTKIRPSADGKALTADIVGLEFTDAQHGRLTTGDHEVWVTSDGGASWQKN
jgi:hypothetical protein